MSKSEKDWNRMNEVNMLVGGLRTNRRRQRGRGRVFIGYREDVKWQVLGKFNVHEVQRHFSIDSCIMHVVSGDVFPLLRRRVTRHGQNTLWYHKLFASPPLVAFRAIAKQRRVRWKRGIHNLHTVYTGCYDSCRGAGI